MYDESRGGDFLTDLFASAFPMQREVYAWSHHNVGFCISPSLSWQKALNQAEGRGAMGFAVGRDGIAVSAAGMKRLW